MRSRTRRALRGALLLIVSGVVVAIAMGVWAGGGAASEPKAEGIQESLELRQQEGIDAPLSRPNSSVPLASGVLREAVASMEQGQTAGLSVDVVDRKIRVEVVHELDQAEAAFLIASVGGVVEGQIEGLAQALVPFEDLVTLEAHANVRYLRPPLEANVPVGPPRQEPRAVGQGPGTIVGEEVVKTNADAWHAAGFVGSGVKIGIIDIFDGGLWDSAVAAGELPVARGTFCLVEGVPCDVWTVFPGSSHGEAVAEIIHEMAPGAQLYVATVLTITDLQAAVDYFASQGVHIISRSLTGKYDGPGDGTGDMAGVIDNAVAQGMAWFNSAGNSASDGSVPGQYWRGQWADGNGNSWLEFADGVELLPYFCQFANGVRWSDFGASSPTDYDVYVYDNPGDLDPIKASLDDQPGGALPLELNVPCRSDFSAGIIEIDYLAINLFDPGGGTAGDVLEFLINNGGIGLGLWQNPYSASGPASDTASPGALSVGAVDPPLGSNIGWYSSQGPTNDERTKPDISVAACVESFTSAPDCFAGTSAAAPAAAGAAALIIDAGLASSPSAVKTYLLNNAVVDRGVAGPDNVFGAGELVLPSPPSSVPGTPTPTLTPTATVGGPTATPTETVPGPAPTATASATATTAVAATATATASATVTATSTATATPTPTPTNTPIPTATHTPSPTPRPVLRGDATCDGLINAVDALFVLQFSAALLANLPCQQNGDVDGSGVVDVIDAALILQLDAGFIDTLAAGHGWPARIPSRLSLPW